MNFWSRECDLKYKIQAVEPVETRTDRNKDVAQLDHASQGYSEHSEDGRWGCCHDSHSIGKFIASIW